ncbi:MAG: serine/threonine protein kinase [Kiritimatiellae bacterium]|nr:serine/threonine protein kinase [Kiritimatiellia bacterium]
MAENDEPMIKTPADFGHFLLEKELGHGGMGGVYLARDKMLDRKVGIKVMLKSLGADPKFVERFQREAQAAARLNHPNIAQIYSFGQEQGMPYIAMELVPGGSLDKEMDANPGTLDVVHVMRVGQQVADALALAAESGLVHGDVKPENVLFDTDGNAKLVDFGLAAMQGDSDEIWGTPYYISPEKVRRQKIDYRADIYSLGGTLYHVLTGVPPFDGPDPTAVVKARFEGPPKKPSEIRSDIPPEVDAIIMRMLELEPSMRYPTYQSLLGDFKRYLAKAGPSKTSKTSGPKIKFKGGKPKMSLSSTGNTALDGEVADLQPIGDMEGQEAEKKRMGVGAMVGMVVGGIVLVLLLVAGGLWWYVSSTKAADEQKNVQEVVDRQQKARESIKKTVKAAQDDYAAFHKSVLQGEEVVEKAIRDMKKVLPEELKAAAADVLAPRPSPVIAQAIAFTNSLFATAAPQTVQAAGGATNAVAAAATNATPAGAMAAAAQGMQSMMAAALGKPATPEQIEKLATKILASAKDTNGEPLDSASPEYKEALDKLKASPEFAMFAQMAAVNPAAVGVITKALSDPANYEQAMKDLGGKLGVKVEEKPAEKPEEKPAEENAAEEKPAEDDIPPLQLPPSVKNFQKLWEDVYQFRAADIKFHGSMLKILELAKGADKLTGQDEDTAQKAIQLANDLVDKYNTLKNEKWLTDARRKLLGIDARARTIRDEAVKKTKLAVERRERAVAEKKAAEEKAAAEKAAAEKLKETIEEERKKAQDGFDEIIRDLKRIDWERCIKHLTRLKEGMTTRDGKLAAEDQIKKVKFMEGMHKYFIKHAEKFVFRDRRGTVLAIVMKADDKTLTIQKAKYVKGKPVPDKEKREDWSRFYGLKERVYLNYMNQFINELVLKGRERKRISSPLEWSEHMLGAALTLHYLYGEEKGVDKFIPELVKKAVKDFEPCRKWAAKWFPEVELEAVQ